MARWQTAALLAAGMALVAGCASASEGEAEVGTTLAPTTVAAPPTTAAPTTAPEVTTAPTQTLPPPTTTLPATQPTTVEDVKQQVIAGFERYLAGVRACAALPDTCVASAFTIPGSPAENGVNRLAAALSSQGYLARPDAAIDFFTVEAFSAEGDTAELTICQVDGGVTFDPRGNTDPSDDIVVNDEIGSTRTVWTLRRVDGSWLPAAGARTMDEAGIKCERS